MLVVGLWLALLCWGFLPGVAEPFLIPRQALFQLGALGVILHTVGTRSARRRWTNTAVLLFLGWTLLRFAWDFWVPLLTTPAMASNILFHWYTLMPFLNILLGFLLAYCLVTHLLPFEPYRHQLTKWLCWISVSVAAYTLLQYVGADQFFSTPHSIWLSHDRPNHMVATMGNVSYVAMFLGLTTPLFLCFRQRRYLGFLALVLLALLLMGKSYGLIGAGAGLLTYGWLRLYHRYPLKRPLVILGALVVLLSALVVLLVKRELLLSNPRWLMWGLMGDFIKKAPLTGFGLGSYAVQFFLNWETIGRTLDIPHQGSRWLWAHNDLWQAVFEFGLIGAGLILMAVVHAFRQGWQKTQTSTGAAYVACGMSLCVMSLMNFPWHFMPTVAVALVIWSMLETEQEESSWPLTPRSQEVLLASQS